MNIIKSKTKFNNFALAFGMLIFLSGCRSVELKTLESAASTIQPTMGLEVYRYTQDEGTTLGKPDYPKVFIEYEPIGNYTKDNLFSEIVKLLKQNGWRTEKLMADRFGYFRASLPQNGFDILAQVVIHPKEEIVSITFETFLR